MTGRWPQSPFESLFGGPPNRYPGSAPGSPLAFEALRSPAERLLVFDLEVCSVEMPGKMPVRPDDEIQEAKLQMARHAPFIDLPVLGNSSETGLVLEVARIATRIPMEPLAWIETTDKDILRLPAELHPWAFDTVALVLAAGGNAEIQMFPTKVEFGVLDGIAYAELL